MTSPYRNIRVYDLPLHATLENSSPPKACQWDIEIQSAMTYGDLVRLVHTLRQRPSVSMSSPEQESTPTFYGTHLNEPLNLPSNLPRDIVESHFASYLRSRRTFLHPCMVCTLAPFWRLCRKWAHLLTSIVCSLRASWDPLAVPGSQIAVFN